MVELEPAQPGPGDPAPDDPGVLEFPRLSDAELGAAETDRPLTVAQFTDN